VSLAVTLLFALARNHPFEQGNKRTAFEAALIFLGDNGYGFTAPDNEALSDAITAVITHAMTEQEFEDAFRPYVGLVDPAELGGDPDDPSE